MSYYQCGDPVRQKEIDSCLYHNIDNNLIDKLFIFIDDGSEFNSNIDKVSIIRIDRRPTYSDWLEKSKSLGLSGVTILCNSDIHFDEDIAKIQQCFKQPKTFIALSRYEVLSNNLELHPNPHWSQDVWAVCTKDLEDKNLFQTLDFPMGVPRCDNKIAYQFSIYGWVIVNPCEFIKSYHIHETGYRTYDKKLDDRLLGGVAYVHPSNKINSPSKLDYDIWVKNSDHITKVEINKSFEKWIRETKEAKQDIKSGKISVNEIKRTDTSNFSSKKSQYSISDFLESGELIQQFAFRFRVYQLGDKVMYIDNLSPNNKIVEDFNQDDQNLSTISDFNFMNWFPPVLDISPIEIRKRPLDFEDCNFWQYPCSTEEQALNNHLKISHGQNLNLETKTIDTYLALPWATYIDKNITPFRVLSILKLKISGLSKFAASLGFTLKVHTVCQQIHWRMFITHFTDIGVTDLHISHMETNIEFENFDFSFGLHSWPLIAVNIEAQERSKGLEFNKDINEKRYLATFIGAHMAHYRSEVRIELLKAAEQFNREDVLIDLGNEWHFNKIVYQEQVLNKAINEVDTIENEDRTLNYNRIISDSIFSLCPEGAGPNTLRLWESMAVGSIPVIFSDEWIAPTIKKLSLDDFAIVVKRESISSVFNYLDQIPHERRLVLQKNCLEAYSKYREFKSF